MTRCSHTRRVLACVALAACLTAYLGHPSGGQAESCLGLVRNGTFEAGSDGAWSEESNLGHVLISDQWPRSGGLGAWLGGEDGSDDVLSQTITIPANASRVTLVYWWSVHTLEEVHPQDTCTVDLREPGGAVVQEGIIHVRVAHAAGNRRTDPQAVEDAHVAGAAGPHGGIQEKRHRRAGRGHRLIELHPEAVRAAGHRGQGQFRGGIRGAAVGVALDRRGGGGG